ncbi:sodium-dependent transporter [Oscillibacter ruminantium]|uniref:sodium-dependent transporter n=1 Tax=Oscillibacter ruminantium TaxID=1263547 RepID=UPI00030DF0A8|nr:sodium-dependent transporter [Oscillibacter ruminantium]MDN0031861.1 sodium-dependent transporter [Oscillibacter valericigenes]
MENERGSWGSNIGFLLAAIGSAVGLGNIWGFPYKMGKSGGFTFLIVYLLLALFVGFTIMMAELALGRKTGTGPIGAYHAVSSRFKWIGWLAVFSPFIIMSFYSVLGGYCIEYMSLNLSNLAFRADPISGGDLFGSMLTNPWGCVAFTLLFMVVCYIINRGGISGGIEKFNTVGMPALFVMLVIIIIKSLSMEGSIEGLKFMFVPGYAVEGGFIEKAPSLIQVISTAGGQMFFSLSLAMGAMITYGSYLDKKENLVKNSGIIVIADTMVATMAGIAVIPAAVAYGIQQGIPVGDIALGGPSLLFVTLQNVFNSMGSIGPLFGVIFYLLVLIAAISSAISLIEVITTFFIDRAAKQGKKSNRPKLVLLVCLAIMVEAALVAVDGLGSNGVPVPFKEMAATVLADGTVQYAGWNDCWLDFMDMLSEGIAMPLGALLMSVMIGWELQPKSMLDEIHSGCGNGIDGFFSICMKILAPLGMVLVLSGQIGSFFGETAGNIGYIIGIIVFVIGFAAAYTSPKRKAALK